MSSDTNFSSLVPAGSPTPVWLSEISNEPLPSFAPANDLSGNGSSSSGAAGQHFLALQQQAQAQQAGIAASNNAFSASLQAQGDAARSGLQSSMASMQAASTARLQASTSALFAGPTVTGPMLPPNFGEKAQAPAGRDGARPITSAPTTAPTKGNADDASVRERLLEAALLPAAIPGGFLRRTVEAAQGMRDSVVSGITLPQDVRAGRVDLGSEEAIRRVLDMATLGMTGGFAGVTTRAGESVLGSGPVGRLGNPLKTIGAQNVRTVIDGREFSGHALDQMSARGVVPSVVENTIQEGAVFPTHSGTIGYYDALNRMRVITDAATGRVVTVIPGAP